MKQFLMDLIIKTFSASDLAEMFVTKLSYERIDKNRKYVMAKLNGEIKGSANVVVEFIDED